jgi:hypothetical protein
MEDLVDASSESATHPNGVWGKLLGGRPARWSIQSLQRELHAYSWRTLYGEAHELLGPWFAVLCCALLSLILIILLLHLCMPCFCRSTGSTHP